jgi:predicted outer membrane lipoprotein
MWYFAFLGVAGVFAVITPLVYNMRQQLRPEQLEQAQERWKEYGPADYDLLWEEKLDGDPRANEYRTEVRRGKVRRVFVNQDMWLAKELATPLGGGLGLGVAALAKERLPERALTGYTVEGLFKTIEKDLNSNADSGSINFATATFDPKDGHPIRYIYRKRRSQERLEWNVKLVRY